MKQYKRILIIGCCGAGKSTLSFKLAKILNLPIYHLDKIYWKTGWIKSRKDEYIPKVKEIVKKDKWIIDGNLKSTFDIRMLRADLILFFDFPTRVCLFRIIKRRFLAKHRQDMAEGCNERLNWGFLKYVWNFKKEINPIIWEVKEKYAQKAEFVCFKNDKEVNNWLEKFKY